MHYHSGLVGVGAADGVKTHCNFVIPYLISTNIPTGDFWTASGITVGNNHSSHIFANSPSGGSNTLISATSIFGANYWNAGNQIKVETAVKFSSVGTNQMGIGLSNLTAPFVDYDDQTADATCFTIDASGNLYAHTSIAATGHTEEAITGITLTNWNVYSIEFNPGTNVKFYVNGVLKATITTNIPSAATAICFGFGSSGNTNYPTYVLNPNFSVEI